MAGDCGYFKAYKNDYINLKVYGNPSIIDKVLKQGSIHNFLYKIIFLVR